MKIYARNGVLYAEFYENEERQRKSLALKDTPENRKYAAKHSFDEIISQTVKIKEEQKQVCTLEHFLNAAIERKIVIKKVRETTSINYASRKNAILNFFGRKKDITEIEIDDVEDFFLSLEGKVCAGTIRNISALLSAAFIMSMRKKLRSDNPVIIADKPNYRPKTREVYTFAQANKIISAASGELKTILAIGLYTGARIGEILALNWSDIDLAKREIKITKSLVSKAKLGLTKTGKARTVKIIPQLKELLEPLKPDGDSILVKSAKGTYCCVTTIRKIMKKLFSEIEIKENGFHALRHTFASLMNESGELNTTIAATLGHANLEMVNKVYVHKIANSNDGDKFSASF